jgi:hypothetical protein
LLERQPQVSARAGSIDYRLSWAIVTTLFFKVRLLADQSATIPARRPSNHSPDLLARVDGTAYVDRAPTAVEEAVGMLSHPSLQNAIVRSQVSLHPLEGVPYLDRQPTAVEGSVDVLFNHALKPVYSSLATITNDLNQIRKHVDERLDDIGRRFDSIARQLLRINARFLAVGDIIQHDPAAELNETAKAGLAAMNDPSFRENTGLGTGLDAGSENKAVEAPVALMHHDGQDPVNASSKKLTDKVKGKSKTLGVEVYTYPDASQSSLGTNAYTCRMAAQRPLSLCGFRTAVLQNIPKGTLDKKNNVGVLLVNRRLATGDGGSTVDGWAQITTHDLSNLISCFLHDDDGTEEVQGFRYYLCEPKDEAALLERTQGV